MAKEIYGIKEDTLKEFEDKLKKNHIRNNMEIEKKYVFPEDKIDKVKEYLLGYKDRSDYQSKCEEEREHIDTYYDTQDFQLSKQGCTFRFREKADKIYITCKYPVESESSGIDGQIERIEYEESVQSPEIKDNQQLIGKFLERVPDTANIISDLQKVVKITNKRSIVLLERKGKENREFAERYEIALDKVVYKNLRNDKTSQECQLEIELKSSYQNRINMKLLTDELEQQMDFLKAIDESKYQRVLKNTQQELQEE